MKRHILRTRAWSGLVSHPEDERGDVPGWVMITVMSAGLVAILGAVAGPMLRQMLRHALLTVGG